MYDPNMSNEELYHYGVKGMRWGVRRASKQLSNATDSASRAKAISSLNKHKQKGSAEIAKLEKQNIKLEKKVEDRAFTIDNKAAKLTAKAAKKRDKSYGLFVSQRRHRKLQFKAKKLEAKAAKLTTKSDQYKTKIEGNKEMVKAFQREINNIDQVLVDKGRKYING